MRKKKLIITIFGSTGDLTARKLLPAITQLTKNKEISDEVLILALGRRDYTLEDYLDYMETLTTSKLDRKFLEQNLEYFKMQITDVNDYHALKSKINEFSDKETRNLFYLAIGPELLEGVSKNINESNLVSQITDHIIFEKPFGHDFNSAKAINQMLWQYFKEEQIYRIDHYLGKEMVRNITSIRFGNRLFDSIWNKDNIESVTILAKEEEGILNRAGYYDTSGALKDMIQSHLLQMLALVAMEKPQSYTSDAIKNEKLKVFKSLSFDSKSSFLGQYEGYLQEKNIPSDSKTDTFVFLKAHVDNEVFKNIPFYLLTGKKLDEKKSQIIIKFKKVDNPFELTENQNTLTIDIAPKEGFRINFNHKDFGLSDELIHSDLVYKVSDNFNKELPEAYEKMILDAINGNNTLFTRWDEIEESWHLIDELIKNKLELVKYDSFDDLKDIILRKDNILV